MATTDAFEASPPSTLGETGTGAATLRWTSHALTVTVWTSAALFGIYILAFYAAALFDGNIQKWNEGLPRLYEAHTPVATAGIGLHFAAGGVILALGCIQFVRRIRILYPAVHRWIGRVYVTAAFLTGVGGITFIAVKGTIGGAMMDIGFAIYGALTIAAAVAVLLLIVTVWMALATRMAPQLHVFAWGSAVRIIVGLGALLLYLPDLLLAVSRTLLSRQAEFLVR